jgi:TadE-like protein
MIHKKGQSAVALIEFAVALPLLIVFLVVLFDSGRYFDLYFRLSNIAWNGTRFFSSLSSVEVACFDEPVPGDGNASPAITTTNLPELLARGQEPALADSPQRQIFDTHLGPQLRIRQLFSVKRASWPIKSDLDGDSVEEPAPSVTIKTQYIGKLGTGSVVPTRCPVNGPTDLKFENTVGVCLSGNYQGFFFQIPINLCSYAFLLINNETSITPSNTTSTNAGNFNF